MIYVIYGCSHGLYGQTCDTNALEDVKLENVEVLKEKRTSKRKPVTTLSVTNAWGEHKPSVSNAWGEHDRAKPSTMKLFVAIPTSSSNF